MLPFGIIACTFFSDNLSRNSCIAVYISLLCRGISDLEISEGLGRGKKKARGRRWEGEEPLLSREGLSFEFVKVCWIRFFKWESFIDFCIWCYPISIILACLFTVGLRLGKSCVEKGAWRPRCPNEMPPCWGWILSKLSRKFVWALGTTTNCRISFTDLFLVISHKF